MEQQQRERAGSVGGTARRLAASGDDAESLEAQGIASLVLGSPTPPPRPDKPLEDPALTDQMRALVAAIVTQSSPQ